jgi:hypothetical protein
MTSQETTSKQLRAVITYGDGPPRVFERNVEAPVDDVAAAISSGMVAFDEGFEHELAWIKERSRGEVEAYCDDRAA